MKHMLKSLLVLLNTSNSLDVGDAGCVDLTPTGAVDMSGASSVEGKTLGTLMYAANEIGSPASNGASFQEVVTGYLDAMQFADNVVDRCFINFAVPEDCDLTQVIEVYLHWSQLTTAAGNVDWTAEYLARADGEDLSAAHAAMITAPITAPGTLHILDVAKLGDIAVSASDKNVNLRVERDAQVGNASDTLGAVAYIVPD